MIKIHCNDSFILADLLNKNITISRKTTHKLDVGYDPVYKQEYVVEKVFVPNSESLKNELIIFADCINNKAKYKTDALLARYDLLILDKIRDKLNI